jgi:hypothetical protein
MRIDSKRNAVSIPFEVCDSASEPKFAGIFLKDPGKDHGSSISTGFT